jgi:hypothetical protein
MPEPYISHLGFKWAAADAAKSALAKYRCYPGFNAGKVLERLSEMFYPSPGGELFEIVKRQVDRASRKVGADKLIYMEVNEEGNSRSSFDINFYGANFHLEELLPSFLNMCRYYSISEDEFLRFYDPLKARTFGHLAGGKDRKGRDFLTVYFGE